MFFLILFYVRRKCVRFHILILLAVAWTLLVASFDACAKEIGRVLPRPSVQVKGPNTLFFPFSRDAALDLRIVPIPRAPMILAPRKVFPPPFRTVVVPGWGRALSVPFPKATLAPVLRKVFPIPSLTVQRRSIYFQVDLNRDARPDSSLR